ncbi:MAG: hypothetical protein PHO94_13935, partial [Petrimonas sp.]|nr:hypothetical protein [Petrimonas sp.]
ILVYLLLKGGYAVSGIIGLFVYAIIYKPLCDAIYLAVEFKYKLSDLIKKYPFWSYEIRKKLYFETKK